MNMKSLLLGSALGLLACTGAFAQDAAAPPVTTTITFNMIADMRSLPEDSKFDTDIFTINLADPKVASKFVLECQSAKEGFFGYGKKERGCQVTGNGNVTAPDGAGVPRTQYSGSYTVGKTGETPADTMTVVYIPARGLPAGKSSFGGSMTLKPELAPSGMSAFKDKILKEVGKGNTGPANDEIDFIGLSGFQVPSAGWPSDKGTKWESNFGFAYQTYSWFIEASATSKGKTYTFTGNMPLTPTLDDKGIEVKNQTQYDIILPLTVEVSDEDAMVEASDEDMMKLPDGISGQIRMTESNQTEVTIGDEKITTPAKIVATGEIVGTGIPPEVVRGFATILTVAAASVFGP